MHLFIDSGMWWSMMNKNLHNFHISFPGSQVNRKITFVVCYICWGLILKQFENYVPKKEKKKYNRRKYAKQYGYYYTDNHKSILVTNWKFRVITQVLRHTIGFKSLPIQHLAILLTWNKLPPHTHTHTDSIHWLTHASTRDLLGKIYLILLTERI